MEIYHNPRCSKSRNALEIINEKGQKVTIIEYLKTPLNKSQIKEILKKLNLPAESLIRKGEDEFKLNFKGKKLSEEQWIDAMVQYPKLIERPIFVNGNKAVIGRPPEKVLDILD